MKATIMKMTDNRITINAINTIYSAIKNGIKSKRERICRSVGVSFSFIFVVASLAGQWAVADGQDPEVVKSVDLQRYSGTWYEIGHYPTFFQNLCDRSEASYTPNGDGTLGVLNTCYRNNKVLTSISGKAFAPTPEEPTKLRVDFGFAREGDYWIISLEENYDWAVVSGPQKNSLFILSRKAPMDPEVLDKILKDLKDRGFDLNKIIFDKY